MTLKSQILDLKSKGIPQYKIAEILGCSSGTVSYHCNPSVKEKAVLKKRIKRNEKQSTSSFLLPKELNIELKTVDWRHAELVVNARLVELGYDTFIPSVSGGEIDLIAHKDGNCYRIQIKSASPTKSTATIHFQRRTRNSLYRYENIDWFLIYDGTNVYKFNFSEVNSSIKLRYRIPLNNQIDKVFMASDYIF
jgi:Holliday junction resolvase-like predicted endonuclease